MNDWYKWSVDKVFDELASSQKGITETEVTKRQEEYGANELAASEGRKWWMILLEQFKDVMIIILIAAAIVSFVVGEHTDAYVILAIIVGNAILGYTQEFNAEKSIQALKKMSAQHAIVTRDGKNIEIDVADLVPGDVVLLSAGDIVPADARLFEVNGLMAEEAALTGESESVSKVTRALDEDGLMPGDKVNMVYKGTIISKGNGKAIVTNTGMNTEMGKIAQMLDAEGQKTPLQIRLAKFSKVLAIIVIVICAIVFGLGLLRGEPVLQMFLTALSLAVAALPEALPAVITIALARGAARMVKRNALIRKLPAVETLGSVTYICSDKTGTLTKNQMTVTHIQPVDGMEELLLHSMMLNNELNKNDNGELLGDSTEIGLVNHVLEQGGDYQSSLSKYPIVETLPFDSDRMMMSTLHKDEDGWLLLVKGAPGKVGAALANKQDEEQWLQINREWAAKGLRVLFFAYKRFNERPKNIDTTIEKDLKMIGVVGIIDPPREEVVDAIKTCRDAGIKVVMITGDQKVTAKAIAKDLSIAEEDDEVITGAELAKMSDEELSNHILHSKVYARVSPEQKVGIVNALQDAGQFVSMTGDGVNDAPSLKQANIGVAMGVTGTDVAKEASHMILLDDNFATIIKAVKEGRRIYDNIKKFVLYVLACNIGEILTILIAPMLGLPLPLLPIHILWINLVTDGLPGIALASEPAERNIMKRAPIPPNENLFARGVLYHILFTGVILAGATLGVQYWADAQGWSVSTQQTIVFNVLCFGQLLNALSVRSAYKSVITTPLFTNPLMLFSIIGTIGLQLALVYVPFLHDIFKTEVIHSDAWLLIVIAAVASLILIELVKKFYYSKAQMR